LPRILHPQALPATDLRVASRLASFSTSGGEAQVAPHFTLSVAPASALLRVAPALRTFRPCRRWIFESPRISDPSTLLAQYPGVSPAATLFQLCLPMRPPGCTGFCIFRLCRRRSLELPRFSRPSALLALMLWVAPRLRSSSRASWCGGGFPRACTFRLCLGLKSPGCPEFSLLRRRLMVPRVASVPAPSGCAVPASSGCPESCIYGWVNDDFPVLLELCILGGAADESSCPIGSCISRSDSGCILNLIRP